MARVKLGDVAYERKETCKGSKDGYPIVGLEHITPEQLTLSCWEEDTENTFTKIFRKGDVLFGRRRAYLKKTAIAPFDGICSGDITVISALENKIHAELLPFIIQNDDFFDFAVGKSAGSLSPRVKWEHLKNYEFNLPDLEEQIKLAELLQGFVTTENAYQKLLLATDELVKSQFIEMFGMPLQKPQRTKEMRLEEVCSVVTDGSHFSPSEDANGKYPMLSVKDMDENGFIYSECKMINEDDYQKLCANGCKPLLGDVLVAKDGSFFKTAFPIKEEIEQAILSSIAILRPISEIIDSTYLARYLMMPTVVETVASEYVTGTAIKRVILKKLKQLPVLVPPIEQQKQFVRLFEQSDKSKFELNSALEELKQLKRKLISKTLN